MLRTAIPAGHAKAEQVAVPFSMHSHTLNRRVKALGRSNQELLDESRFEVARQLLNDSRMEITERLPRCLTMPTRDPSSEHFDTGVEPHVRAGGRTWRQRGEIRRVSSPSRTAMPLRGPIR